MRRGFGAQEGIAVVMAGIFVAVFLYVVAFTTPQALTALATAALVSVSSGPQTLFQTLLSIIAVIVLILVLLGVARKATE
jgi:TRAP-type mannitol/chloroaromatic compound transport system permease large subunit